MTDPRTLPADQVSIDDLPPVLREIAALIGIAPALTLVRHFGGVRVYVPQVMTPEHTLARLLGFEAALKLADHYGGAAVIEVPRALDAMIAVRNAHIRAQYRTTEKSQRDLALEHRMTERWIREIVGDDPTDDPQVDLFSQSQR